jgi:hypothetical protein
MEAGESSWLYRLLLIHFLNHLLLLQLKKYANLYILFIFLLESIPGSHFSSESPSMLYPLLFSLCVGGINDLLDDKARRRGDFTENSRVTRVYSPIENRFLRVKWGDICVGDAVFLRNRDTVPADMVPLSCSNFDGTISVMDESSSGQAAFKVCRIHPDAMLHTDLYSYHVDTAELYGVLDCDKPSVEAGRFSALLTKMEGWKGNALNREGLPTVRLSGEHLLTRGSQVGGGGCVSACAACCHCAVSCPVCPVCLVCALCCALGSYNVMLCAVCCVLCAVCCVLCAACVLCRCVKSG